MTEPRTVTVDEALAAVQARAFTIQVTTCGHTGCTDHLGDGPRIIHCYAGFGVDMSLEQAEEEIRTAQAIQWVDHLLDHDLAVRTATGRVHCYDVPDPGSWVHGR